MSSEDNFQSTDQFRPSHPGSEPLTTSGHQVGYRASSQDAIPEFSAKTYPPGTAPKEDTYESNINAEATDDPDASAQPDAADTLTGATSGDVHTGYGQPIQGQSSHETHGLGKKDRQGLGSTAGGAVDINAAATTKDAQEFQRDFQGGDE